MTKFNWISVLILVLYSSCKTIPCVDSNPILYFVSFSNTETDSIILRKYVKNSVFDTVIDSTIISKNNSDYEKSNDTLHVFTSNGGDYSLDTRFDYVIYLPQANQQFQISNFVEQQTDMTQGISSDRRQCINPIKSYVLNGQTISGDPDYHFIYLQK